MQLKYEQKSAGGVEIVLPPGQKSKPQGFGIVAEQEGGGGAAGAAAAEVGAAGDNPAFGVTAEGAAAVAPRGGVRRADRAPEGEGECHEIREDGRATASPRIEAERLAAGSAHSLPEASVHAQAREIGRAHV